MHPVNVTITACASLSVSDGLWALPSELQSAVKCKTRFGLSRTKPTEAAPRKGCSCSSESKASVYHLKGKVFRSLNDPYVHIFMESITTIKVWNPSAQIPDKHFLYAFMAELLNCQRLRAKNRIIPQDDTPCYYCYRLLHVFTTFLTFPI